MSIIDASPSVGYGLEAAALPPSLIHPNPVSSPQSVPSVTPSVAFVEKEIDCALCLPQFFQLEEDCVKFNDLVIELRARAAKVDEIFAAIESPATLPLFREKLYQKLEILPGAAYSRDVTEFSVTVRMKGDDLGIQWQLGLYFLRPAKKPYDFCAAQAGEIIIEAFDALRNDTQRRLSMSRSVQALRMDTFEAGPLVGPLTLNPELLLEEVPPSLRAPLKSLMQGRSSMLREEAAKIEQSTERHCPAVFAALRYAVVHNSREALGVMARGFPEYKGELLAFVRGLLGSPQISDSFKRAARLAAAYARPEILMRDTAATLDSCQLAESERGEIMRYWMGDPVRGASLDPLVREYFSSTLLRDLVASRPPPQAWTAMRRFGNFLGQHVPRLRSTLALVHL